MAMAKIPSDRASVRPRAIPPPASSSSSCIRRRTVAGPGRQSLGHPVVVELPGHESSRRPGGAGRHRAEGVHMRRKRLGIVAGIAGLAVAATVVVTGPVFAHGDKGSGKGNVFVGSMTGGVEVPPGDPN